MTIISFLLLFEIIGSVGEPFLSLATYLFWTTTILLAGGLMAAFALKEKGVEELNTMCIIGDLVILISLVLFTMYTIWLYIWLIRQYVSFYRFVIPFN